MAKALVVLLAVLTVAGCSRGPTPEYDKYEKLCHDRGGIVSTVNVGWATVTYQCIGDTFAELLPKFSG